jgi:TonB family protein
MLRSMLAWLLLTPIWLLLPSELPARPGADAEDPYDESLVVVGSFAETMFERIRALPVECPESSGDVTAMYCAGFAQGFSTFKFRWDEGVRVLFVGEAKKKGSWRRKPQEYVREYSLAGMALTARFAEGEQSVRLEFRRPVEPEEEEDVATRLVVPEALLACDGADELPEDLATVTPPSLIPESDINPFYPEAALDARAEGSVILRLLIGRDGAVSRAELMRTDRPGVGFEEAAKVAAKQWRYEPARIGERAIEYCVEVTLRFLLPGTDPVDPSDSGT